MTIVCAVIPITSRLNACVFAKVDGNCKAVTENDRYAVLNTEKFSMCLPVEKGVCLKLRPVKKLVTGALYKCSTTRFSTKEGDTQLFFKWLLQTK